MSDYYALLADRTFTPEGIRYKQYVVVKEGVISAVSTKAPTDCPIIELPGQSLLPGFIDIHIHGRGGADVMDNTPDTLQTIADALPSTGVVAWVGTTVTAPIDDICLSLERMQTFIQHGQTQGAELLGSFLEGPYFTAAHRGAHPIKYLKAPTRVELEKLYSFAKQSLLRVAIAPESAGATEAIEWLVAHGIKTAVAHTAANFQQVTDAFAVGADCGVHLYNGMSGLHHREPGCSGAILYHDVLAELIADGVHVHPVMMQLAYRIKGYRGIALITDCMRAGGLPDGEYMLGTLPVQVCDGQAKTADGSLAGSTCSLNQALKNMIYQVHVPEWEALQMATYVPAKYLGLEQRLGHISPGADASFAVVDPLFNLTQTIIGGKTAYTCD